MSGQRLIDANEMNPFDICQKSCVDGVATLRGWVALQPTIDPETLPIVQELRKENDELKQRIVFWNEGMITEQQKKIAELREKLERYEQAEEEGRLLTLPCKIGDNIYVIPSKVNYNLNKLSHPENNKVYKQMVSGIRMYHGNDYLLETCEGFCTVLASYFESTWFLTREEAEAALKERGKSK